MAPQVRVMTPLLPVSRNHITSLTPNSITQEKFLTPICLFLLAVSFGVQPVTAQYGGEYPNRKQLWTQATPDYIPDQLLVTFNEGVPESRIKAINESLNVQVITTLQPGRTYLIKVPKEKSLEDVRQAYSSFPEVKSVNLNYKVRME